MQKKLGIWIVFLLAGCTTDSTPDEEFEVPSTNFPLLNQVPDRPVRQESESLSQQQRLLKYEHDQAIKQQDEIIQSIKP